MKTPLHGLRLGSLLLLSCFLIEQSYAAFVPTTVEPGRVGQDITPFSPAPKRGYLPAKITPPEQTTFPKEVAAIPFKLNKVDFEGNTLYSDQDLLTLLNKPLGSTVTLGEIQTFANNISLKYNKAGYLLSQAIIPEQTIKDGVIKIKIIEGFIDRVIIQGDVSEKTKALMQRYGNKVVGKKPLNVHELESTLLLANDVPGITVQSVITPSKTVPNAAELTLLVQHDYVDGTSYITYDNRGTRYIGPTRVIASGYVNTSLGDGAMTGMKLADSGAQWEQMRYVELEHKQFIGTNGFTLDLDGQYTRTRPGFILTGTDTIGINKFFQLTAQYPIIRQRSQNLSVNANFAYVNSFLTQFDTKIYNDQIRTLQLGAQYDSQDQYRGSNQLSGSVMQGFNMLGASQPGNLVSRFDAKPDFTKFNASGGRLQGLFSVFSALLTTNAQYACNKMYAYEQIGYGGLPFGDAYDPSEIIADRGLMAKLELRADTRLPFTNIPTQYFVYGDGGVLWNVDHINQPGRQSGTSAGFGLRSTAWNHLNISLELAKPLNRAVAATQAIPGGTENPRAWRGFFSLNVSA